MHRLLPIALVGCVAALPPVPGKGGPAWFEMSTEHFTLWTDTEDGRARELLAHLEHIRQVVLGTTYPTHMPTGRSLVIAMRDDRELHTFVPERIGAVAWPPPSSALHQAMILMSAEQDPQSDQLEAHELVHVISWGVIRNQPRWYAEGLATFFATIDIDADSGTVDIGRPPDWRGQRLVMHHLMPLSKMFACTELECADEAFYSTAWAFFTYLVNARREELGRFEESLDAAGKDWRKAFDAAFAGTTLDKLDEDLRRWIVEGSHLVLHFKVKLKSWPVTRGRTLTDADVYAIRALARAQLLAPAPPEALGEITEALRLDPDHVVANLVAVRLDLRTTLDRAKAIVAKHPDDWRAWLLQGVVAKEGPDAAEAVSKLCELAGGDSAIALPRDWCAP